MTVVNMRATLAELTGPVAVAGVVKWTPWAGRGPVPRVEGSDVVLPSTSVVEIPAGDPAQVTVEPSTGEWCWRVRVEAAGMALRRFVSVPPSGTVDFGDLPVVDPMTFTPVATPPSIAEQFAALQEQIESIEGGGEFSGDADDIPDGSSKVIMTTGERSKLAGVASGATANQSDATTNAAIAAKLNTSDAAELIRDTMGAALVAGSNVTVTPNDAGDTITVATSATVNATDAQLRDRSTHTGTQTSASISDFTEAVQDAVAALLAQGTNVTLSYNDAGNQLTISSTGGGGGLDAEAVRDAIGVAMLGVGNITVTVNDAADTITISTTATVNATDAALRDRGTHTGEQAISTVTGLQAALDGKQAAGSYAAASHTHTIANVTGLQTALDGKQASGSYAAASHTHTASAVTDFATAADARVNTLVPTASTTAAGKVELATDAETITGTDTARAVTPAGLTAALGAKLLVLDNADPIPGGTPADAVIIRKGA